MSHFVEELMAAILNPNPIPQNTQNTQNPLSRPEKAIFADIADIAVRGSENEFPDRADSPAAPSFCRAECLRLLIDPDDTWCVYQPRGVAIGFSALAVMADLPGAEGVHLQRMGGGCLLLPPRQLHNDWR